MSIITQAAAGLLCSAAVRGSPGGHSGLGVSGGHRLEVPLGEAWEESMEPALLYTVEACQLHPSLWQLGSH